MIAVLNIASDIGATIQSIKTAFTSPVQGASVARANRVPAGLSFVSLS